MAKFVDLVKSGKVKAAYLQKQGALADITYNLNMIKDLDRETPNVRIFSTFVNNANGSLDKLRVTSNELNILLYDANPNYASDESYIADLKYDRGQHFSLCAAIDDYSVLLNSKGITYPPDNNPVDMSGDLATIVTNLLESQDKKVSNLLEAQDKKQEKLLNTSSK